jgi:hypothetical protein
MNFCSKTPLNATQWALILSSVQSTYVMLPAFNYAAASMALADVLPMSKVANLTLKAKTPGEILRLALLERLPLKPKDCIDPNNAIFTGAQQTANTGDAFAYIQCSYYPFSLNGIEEGGLFRPSQSNPAGCPYPQWRAPDFNETAQHWNEKFGTTTEKLNEVRRMVIFQGTYDSVSGIGVPPLESSPDREHSRVILTPRAPHGEDMFSFEELPRGVSPRSDMLRDIKLGYLRDWLASDSK